MAGASGRDVIDYLNERFTGGLVPGVTFFLDIDPEEGLHRVGKPQAPNGADGR